MIIKKHSENKTNKKQEKISQTPSQINSQQEHEVEENVDIFDIDNIDFSQRQERRRGNRRRGYRRIDDRNLISRAQEEAGSIRDSAAQEGYKAGVEKAEADIAQMKEAIKDFLNSKQEVFDIIAPDILEISLDIAHKIIKKEIKQDSTSILEMIKDVLKSVSKEEPKITIKVNTLQLDMLKEHLPEIVSSGNIDAKVNAIADDSIEEGSCKVETQNGIVDASIETQIEIIKNAFKGM